jgi:hypothetical protein
MAIYRCMVRAVFNRQSLLPVPLYQGLHAGSVRTQVLTFRLVSCSNLFAVPTRHSWTPG